MGFGRKWLEEIVDDQELTAKEKVQKIMDEHLTVFNPVKDERDNLKTQAADLQKQLEDATSGENWQEKFEKEHTAFEDFKKKTAEDAHAANVRSAYRKLLAEEKIPEKRLDAILKVTDLSKVKLDKDGSIENAEELRKAINDEWSEFKTTVTEKGAVVEKPPHIGKATKTKAEIDAIKDTAERQKAILENHELFGF